MFKSKTAKIVYKGFAAGSVTTDMIADRAVTAKKLAEDLAPLPLVITPTKTEAAGGRNITYTFDCTYAQVRQAIESGRTAYVLIDATNVSSVLPLGIYTVVAVHTQNTTLVVTTLYGASNITYTCSSTTAKPAHTFSGTVN